MGEKRRTSVDHAWSQVVICSLILVLIAWIAFRHYAKVRHAKLIEEKHLREHGGKSSGHDAALMKKSLDELVIDIGTPLAIVFFFLQPFWRLLVRSSELNGNRVLSCYAFVQLSSVSWALAKNCLYLVLLARAKVSFKGSVFGYGTRLITTLYVAVVINCLAMSLLGIFLVDGEPERTNRNASGNHISLCVVTGSSAIILAYGAITDTIFTLGLSVLFVRPLQKLFKMTADYAGRSNGAADNADTRASREKYAQKSVRDLEIEMLPLRHASLSLIAVFSTLLTLSTC